MGNLAKYLTTAGAAVLLCFIASVILLRNSAFDTGQRGAGQGAVAASGALLILWVLLAALAAIARWKSTGFAFRLLLVVNGTIACMLVANI